MAIRTPKPTSEHLGAPESTESAAATAEIEVVVDDAEEEPVEQIKMKGFVEAIVSRTGQRKGEVRTAVQAALAIMGEALAEGKDLHLPPLGKMKVNRMKDTPRGQMMIVKLVQNRKQPQTEYVEDDPLAEFEQDG